MEDKDGEDLTGVETVGLIDERELIRVFSDDNLEERISYLLHTSFQKEMLNQVEPVYLEVF